MLGAVSWVLISDMCHNPEEVQALTNSQAMSSDREVVVPMSDSFS